MKEEMNRYWKENSEIFLKAKDTLSAICHAGMPNWFNDYMDYFIRKSFFNLTKNINFKDKKILDIGCGIGRWTKLLQNSNQVIGIDVEPERLNNAKKNVPQSKFIEMSADSLKFKDKSFDLINSITVLQHIPYDDKNRAIREISRVAKKGAYLILIELIDMGDDAKHVFPLDYEEWIKKFEREGFKLLSTNGFDYSPLLRLVRWLNFFRTGKKSLKKKNNRRAISSLDQTLLRPIIWLSYPIERVLSKIMPPRFARHGGYLFKKIN